MSETKPRLIVMRL